MRGHDLDFTWDKLKESTKLILNQYISEGIPHIVVALSGGLDSTMALHLVREGLAELGEGRKNGKLAAIHFAYGIRGEESAEEARFVEETCRERGIPLTLITAPPPPTTGIQEWARGIRLKEYQRLIAEGAVVVTGHHRDDVVETALLRLVRGSHPAGLLGMTARSAGMWRPLLSIDRDTIAALARRKNLPYRHDSSNDTLNYSRNRVRLAVLPQLEAIHSEARSNIVTVAKNCAELSAFVAEGLDATLAAHNDRPPVSWLNSLPEAVASMVLGLMIRKARNTPLADPHQPGGPIAAFLKGLAALNELRDQSKTGTLPVVALAGGGFLTVVADDDPQGQVSQERNGWRVVYTEGDAPFAAHHARHRSNLGLRPVQGRWPQGGQLAEGGHITGLI